MAKGSSIRSGDLFADGKLSQIRNLLSDQPNASRFDSSISVPANIAEGFKKRGLSDKIRFLNVAQGSLEECRYYLILVQDLGYSPTAEMEEILEEISKLLGAYVSAIESKL